MTAADTRTRILDATAEHFRRHGYHGTGLKQIVTDAAAPFGSLYHHFPGGKEELGAAALRRSGAMYRDLFEMVFDAAPDARRGLADFFDGAAYVLEASDYADACPIATVALEIASTSDTMRAACAEVFESWLASVSTRLVAAGLTDDEARRAGLTAIMLLEGAFLLCRASRTTEPMGVARDAALAALPPPPGTRPTGRGRGRADRR